MWRKRKGFLGRRAPHRAARCHSTAYEAISRPPPFKVRAQLSIFEWRTSLVKYETLPGPRRWNFFVCVLAGARLHTTPWPRCPRHMASWKKKKKKAISFSSQPASPAEPIMSPLDTWTQSASRCKCKAGGGNKNALTTGSSFFKLYFSTRFLCG